LFGDVLLLMLSLNLFLDSEGDLLDASHRDLFELLDATDCRSPHTSINLSLQVLAEIGDVSCCVESLLASSCGVRILLPTGILTADLSPFK
jgi:hypothetical protein